MNQKWQKLLTTALCCSLLISSLNGISVLAETMVVENETTTETEKQRQVRIPLQATHR